MKCLEISSPRWQKRVRTSIFVAVVSSLSACTTPRLHSVEELNRVGAACNLAAGELVQEPELKKVVILFREAPTPAERSCVYQWARKNHLRLTIIEAVTYRE